MKVSVNGETIEVPDGASINLDNGVVTITSGGDVRQLTSDATKIVIQGNTGNIYASQASIEVRGNVTGSVIAGGNVNCDGVGGGVYAGGSVNCDDVRNGVAAKGSVNCGDVYGTISR